MTLALGCPGDLAANPTTSTGAADPSTGHSDTGAVTEADGAPTTSTTTTDSTSSPAGTTAALDDTGPPASTGDTSTGDTSTGDTSTGPDTTSSETGEPPPCGNGVLDPLEQCDDANADDADACRNDCTLGTGAKEASFPLDLGDGDAFCITRAGTGLALGSTEIVYDDEVKQMFGDVRRLPLPQGAPAAWTYHEKAGDYGRWPQQAATMSNGDIIVAGMVYTEIKKVDSGGYLWLARFTPAGALVWSRELKPQYFGVLDLELGADDRIVVVGRSYACCGAAPFVAAFDPAGLLLWQFQAPFVDGQWEFLTGVTVGPDSRVYVAGDRYNHDDVDTFDWRVLVRGLAADGAPLWEVEQFPPDLVRTSTADIVLTTDGSLVVATAHRDLDDPQQTLPELALAGFSTAGAPLWSKQWAPPAWTALPSTLLASDDGGFHLFGSAEFADEHATLVARFAGDGAPVWTKLAPGPWVIDATRGPDDLLYVLTDAEISAYTP